jgi:hypothetical protein
MKSYAERPLRVSRAALIVIDMITSYDFPDAEKLIPSVEETLPVMREAIDRARSDGVLTIYVNDHYGKWRSSSDELVEQALQSPHRDLVEPIAPHEDALFVAGCARRGRAHPPRARRGRAEDDGAQYEGEPQPSARLRLYAALINARCVKACGKLPSCSPVGPISSE